MRLASAGFSALGTSAVVAVADPAALPQARAILDAELSAIDLACSRFRPDSELSAVNAAAGREVEVGALFLEAVSAALRVAQLTEGLVDPTVGANLRLAGYDRTFRELHLRDGRHVQVHFTKVPGWRTVRVDPAHSTVRIPSGVELDLGASAKALAADRASSAAANATGCGVLVSLGGDIAVAGRPPQGGWPIRVADDHMAPLDGPGPVVAVSGGGLATSGTRVRHWTTSAGELHHILDPRTGRPAVSPWKTVTVAAASCVLANAASTAAVVLGEVAVARLRGWGLPARLASEDGAVAAINGWPTE